MAKKLTLNEAREAMSRLEGWSLEHGKLHKEFTFRSFDCAIAFINKLRPIADRIGHHPEIFNVYNKVVLDLVTHDAGGLTKLDFEFAEKVDALG